MKMLLTTYMWTDAVSDPFAMLYFSLKVRLYVRWRFCMIYETEGEKVEDKLVI